MFAARPEGYAADKTHQAAESTYIHIEQLSLAEMIPPPPARHSATEQAEFAKLLQTQNTRTPEEIKAAQADDREEDIFIYRTVLGDNFQAPALPLTQVLSGRIHDAEGFISTPLKEHFQRPRPYQIDSELHPVCKVTEKHNAYPSGHTLGGYLQALALIAIVPEKSAAILARADDYAHNRMVCGVHTASDLEASRRLAYLLFGNMLHDPQFQRDLAAARTEIRHAQGYSH